MNRSTVIPASGAIVQETLGVFLYLKITTASAPFQISFDGSQWQDAAQNSAWGPIKPTPQRAYFRAKNGLAANVTLQYDTKAFQSQDTAQSDVASYAYGSGGAGNYISVPIGKAADNTSYDQTSAKPLDLTKAGPVFIPGTRNGQKRKQITWQNNSQHTLCIFDALGNLFLVIPGVAAGGSIGTPYTYATSADFWIASTVGGVANSVCYNELYYSTI